ncbi:MAG: hypothetical protein HQK50_18445 [Oligoflexia bacterium]|nr:hypothetical protein [Oligoflexia bacterium]
MCKQKCAIITLMLFLSTLLFPLKIWGEQTELQVDFEKLSPQEIAYYLLYKEESKRLKLLSDLKLLKFMILSGNTSYAKKLIIEGDFNTHLGKLITRRYLAVIAFIEGDYLQSFQISKEAARYNLKSLENFCLQKLMSEMILFTAHYYHVEVNLARLLEDYGTCSLQNYRDAPTGHLWMQLLVNSLNPKSLMRIRGLDFVFKILNNASNEELAIWLKFALFFDQIEPLKEMISTINEEFLQDPQIRELLGIIYYRYGNSDLALELLQGITTANSEIVRGNIKLANKEYELAYGHFQYALKRKPDSLNALERIVPLAWVLGKWEEGILALHELSLKTSGSRDRTLLTALFFMRQEKYQPAYRQLRELQSAYHQAPPLEVNRALVYTSLLLKAEDDLKVHARSACEQNDALSCLHRYYLEVWTEYSKTVNNQEKISDSNEFTLEKIKNLADPTPIAETLFIHQNELENLNFKY